MADLILEPVTELGGAVVLTQKVVDGQASAQRVLRFGAVDLEAFDLVVYEQDADGNWTPVASTVGVAEGSTGGSAPAPGPSPTVDAYTKMEADALLTEKADRSTTYTKTETDALLDTKASAEDVELLFGVQRGTIVVRNPSGAQQRLAALPTGNWVAGSTLQIHGQVSFPALDWVFPGGGTLYLGPGAVLTVSKLRPPGQPFTITGPGTLVGTINVGPNSPDTLVENITLRGDIYAYSFGGGDPRRLRVRNTRWMSTGNALTVDYGYGGFYHAYATVELVGNDITAGSDVVKWFDQTDDQNYVAADAPAKAANKLLLSSNSITAPADKRVLNDTLGRLQLERGGNTYHLVSPPAQSYAKVSTDTSEIRSGSVIQFDRSADYELVTSGTVTMDLTGIRAGATVSWRLGPGATKPTLPAEFYVLFDNSVDGNGRLYNAKVEPDLTISCYINLR